MAGLGVRFRRATRWAGRTAAARATNLTTAGIGAGFIWIALSNQFDSGVRAPLLVGLGLAAMLQGGIRLLNRFLPTSSDGFGLGWGQIAVKDGVLLVRSLKAGTIEATRLSAGGDQTKFQVEAEAPSLALSADGTLAATLHQSKLRFALIDPRTGDLTSSWSSPVPVKVPAARVVALANKGDSAVWCAVTGGASHRAAIIPNADPAWKMVRVDGEPVHGETLAEARAAAFLGHELWILGTDANIYRTGPDGMARQRNPDGLGNWVAMDAALVGGVALMALVRTTTGTDPKSNLVVFDMADFDNPVMVHNVSLKDTVDPVRVVRSPLTAPKDLSVITVNGSDRQLHSCPMHPLTEPVGAG